MSSLSLLTAFEKWQMALFQLTIFEGKALVCDPFMDELEGQRMKEEFVRMIVEPFHRDFIREAVKRNTEKHSQFCVLAPGFLFSYSGGKSFSRFFGRYIFDRVRGDETCLGLFNQQETLLYFPVKEVVRVETFGHTIAIGDG